MTSLSFVLIGSVQSTKAALEALHTEGANVKAVVTLAPTEGRKRHSDYVDLAPICKQMGFACHPLEPGQDIDHNLLRQINPDALLVFGWSRLISNETISLSRYGAIGLHPAPLPLGRGRHPLIWTILLGLKESAVCFFRLEESADTGDILLRRNFPIKNDETAMTLMHKVITETRLAIPELLGHLEKNGITGMPQNHREAVVWRKRTKQDGCLDFRMSADLVSRHVRALSRPYPGATAIHCDGEERIIWAVEQIKLEPKHMYAEPGKIIGEDGGDAIIACGEGAVIIREHEFDKPKTVGSWFQ